MFLIGKNPVLLIIDVQKGFDDPVWGERNNKGAEDNIARLLEKWRRCSLPIVHIQHLSIQEGSPLRSGQIGCEFKDQVKPLLGEKVIQKSVNSAFIGTDLEVYLRQNHLHTLVICGLTTDHCVSTTTRMASNLGFNTYVLEDATATFKRLSFDGREYTAEEIHQISLVSLHREFGVVTDTNSMLEAINLSITLR